MQSIPVLHLDFEPHQIDMRNQSSGYQRKVETTECRQSLSVVKELMGWSQEGVREPGAYRQTGVKPGDLVT